MRLSGAHAADHGIRGAVAAQTPQHVVSLSPCCTSSSNLDYTSSVANCILIRKISYIKVRVFAGMMTGWNHGRQSAQSCWMTHVFVHMNGR